jgi:intermembrane space import and assembly protein 40
MPPLSAASHPPSDALLPDTVANAGFDAGSAADAENTPSVDGETATAAQGGAFNPETDELNWDCPCPDGMAHGPCGPQFREAFAFFVYSQDEPKGIKGVRGDAGLLPRAPRGVCRG